MKWHFRLGTDRWYWRSTMPLVEGEIEDASSVSQLDEDVEEILHFKWKSKTGLWRRGAEQDSFESRKVNAVLGQRWWVERRKFFCACLQRDVWKLRNPRARVHAIEAAARAQDEDDDCVLRKQIHPWSDSREKFANLWTHIIEVKYDQWDIVYIDMSNDSPCSRILLMSISTQCNFQRNVCRDCIWLRMCGNWMWAQAIIIKCDSIKIF